MHGVWLNEEQSAAWLNVLEVAASIRTPTVSPGHVTTDPTSDSKRRALCVHPSTLPNTPTCAKRPTSRRTVKDRG